MNIDINQVGKRWFLVTAISPSGRTFMVDVEASYAAGTDWVNEKLSGYYKPVPVTRWTLTGEGARKHRMEIISALEKHIEGDKA